MIQFHSPLFLFLLLFVPLFLGIRPRWKRQSRQIGAFQFSSAVALSQINAEVKRRSFRVKILPRLVRAFNVISFSLLVVALARPQLGSSFREVEWSGKDLMFALDISGSMQALDFFIDGKRVDRLAALKLVLNKFIDKRNGDRMGLVIFGDKVFTQSPLTLDQGALKQYVNALEVGMAGQGTAIGDGLGIALKRIKDIAAQSKVIVLVTDGKNNSGTLSPNEAVKLAQELGVKIHVVGIGSNDPAPFPRRSPFGFNTVVTQQMEYDEQTLKMIADRTGGVYFNARETERLSEIYDQIDKLEERKERSLEFVNYEERFLPALLLGMFLWLGTQLMSQLVLLKIP